MVSTLTLYNLIHFKTRFNVIRANWHQGKGLCPWNSGCLYLFFQAHGIRRIIEKFTQTNLSSQLSQVQLVSPTFLPVLLSILLSGKQPLKRLQDILYSLCLISSSTRDSCVVWLSTGNLVSSPCIFKIACRLIILSGITVSKL